MYLRPADLENEPALEVQRVAANAHQAVASQRFSSQKTFEELRQLESRTEKVLPQLEMQSMHPRVLTVLLRLVVDSTSKADGTVKQYEESDILRLVKQLFKKVSTTKLFGWHPVALLCSMPGDQDHTDQLLHHQMELAKVDFYDKVRYYDPLFVAWEEIYSARVLASLGHTDEAEVIMEAVFDSFSHVSSHEELFAHADACRTWGYTKLNAGSPEHAVPSLNQALDEFRRSGNGKTENVLYTHLVFSWLYRRLNELYLCEHSLREALKLWKSD